MSDNLKVIKKNILCYLKKEFRINNSVFFTFIDKQMELVELLEDDDLGAELTNLFMDLEVAFIQECDDTNLDSIKNKILKVSLSNILKYIETGKKSISLTGSFSIQELEDRSIEEYKKLWYGMSKRERESFLFATVENNKRTVFQYLFKFSEGRYKFANWLWGELDDVTKKKLIYASWGDKGYTLLQTMLSAFPSISHLIYNDDEVKYSIANANWLWIRINDEAKKSLLTSIDNNGNTILHWISSKDKLEWLYSKMNKELWEKLLLVRNNNGESVLEIAERKSDFIFAFIWERCNDRVKDDFRYKN